MPPPNPSHGAPPPSIDLGDIYYALFRHKKKIAVCTVLGLIASGFAYKYNQPLYSSEAKVLVKYVINEDPSVGPGADKDSIKSPDRGGETIMESEQQLLTSLDLAMKTAEAIGPKKILAKVGGGDDPIKAAGLIHRGLRVGNAYRSSVITAVLNFPDPEMAQTILRELINQYEREHKAIHQSGNISELLAQQRDTFKQRLASTEQTLLDLQNKAGILSTVAEARKDFGAQLSRILEQLQATQVAIAEKAAVLAELSKAGAAQSTDGGTVTEASAAKTREYTAIITRVEEQRKRVFDLLRQYAPENNLVVQAKRLLAEAEADQARLEQETPELLRSQAAAVGKNPSSQPTVNLSVESASIAGLQQRIRVLGEQYENIRKKESDLDQYDLKIAELVRQRDRETQSYMFYATEVEKNSVTEQMTGDRIQNIRQIEAATPAFADWKKTYQTTGAVAASGLGLGIVWALFIELYFDRSVRRARHLERLIKYPLFLSIPAIKHKASKVKQRMGWKRKKRYDDIVVEASDKAAAAAQAAATGASTELALIQHPLADGSIAPWDKNNELVPFHETLRDRLIGYFEGRGLTHKPKVIGVTGLAHGAGVTTTAAGLAASLSETGDGNVLLVDLTPGRNASHEFFRGKPAVGLDQLLASRESAQIQSNLFVAADSNTDRMAQAMPQRFSKLVPQLKSSDFDYIIFDMPPVSQISVTPRLAGFMDMVLMIIESEKDHEELVKRASALLGESKAHVGVVLNKTKNYVPHRLYQDGLEMQ